MVNVVRVGRAAVYHNTAGLTLEEIKESTGAKYAFNAWLFDNDRTSVNYLEPCGWLVVDGVEISRSEFNDWGFGVGEDGLPVMTTDRKVKYFVDAVPILKDGAKLQRNLTPDVARRAERTAVGWLADGRVLVWCDKEELILEELQDKLLELGCVDALMFDGGGSVQGIFPDGKVYSSRIVATVILLWDAEDARWPDTLKEDKDMSKKVCLDAGHDAGNKANASPDKTFYEHEFVLDMAKRIGAILEAHGVAVTYTRKGGEVVTLEKRCKIANGVKDLDLFVSLHTNAAAGGGWSSAKGWEAFIYALAGERYKAAKAILARVDDVAAAMRQPPIKEGPELYVIRNTSTPAVLIEHGFHTNREEVALMNTDAYRQKLAEAEAYGILDYLGIAVKPKEKTEAELAVEWITGNGIMAGGTDGDLMLEEMLTRKQFAVMLYRFAKKFDSKG